MTTGARAVAGNTELSGASHFTTFLGQGIAFDPATTMRKVFTWETQGLHFFITLILPIMPTGKHGIAVNTVDVT